MKKQVIVTVCETVNVVREVAPKDYLHVVNVNNIIQASERLKERARMLAQQAAEHRNQLVNR